MIGRERLEKAKSFVRVLLPGYALLCDFDSGNPIISFAYPEYWPASRTSRMLMTMHLIFTSQGELQRPQV